MGHQELEVSNQDDILLVSHELSSETAVAGQFLGISVLDAQSRCLASLCRLVCHVQEKFAGRLVAKFSCVICCSGQHRRGDLGKTAWRSCKVSLASLWMKKRRWAMLLVVGR